MDGTRRSTALSSRFSSNSSSSLLIRSRASLTSFHAVQIRKAPKMKKTQEKLAMIVAPAAMNTARSTSAISTPTSSTRCW